MSTLRTLTATAVLAAAVAAPVVAATPAFAQGGGDRPRVSASGACTAGGSWKLEAKSDDGGIEIEFEVETHVPGQAFAVRVTDGTTVVFHGTRTTSAAGGSFTVRRVTVDQAGRDTVRAVATRGATTCTGVVRL